MSSNFPPEHVIKQEFLHDVESLGGPMVVSFATLTRALGDKPLYNQGEERNAQLMFMLDYVKNCPFPEYMIMLDFFKVKWSEQTLQRKRQLMVALMPRDARDEMMAKAKAKEDKE